MNHPFAAQVLGALLVVYVFQDDLRVPTLLAYSFWLPQICKNCRDNTRARAFHPLFLAGTAANRLALVYGRGLSSTMATDLGAIVARNSAVGVAAYALLRRGGA